MAQIKSAVVLAATLLAACANDPVNYGPAVGSDSGTDRDAFIGQVASTGPNCPGFTVHVERNGPNTLGGVMFAPTDPMRMSGLEGTVASNGAVSFKVNPMTPAASGGTMTGQMQGDRLTVSMVGGRCEVHNIILTNPRFVR
ncbi:MAG TPA: hypothetical protein VHS58_19530 [Acetobacteraceae bacterium]|jgi:hypothetical protein|nr:hypothetical protein [Acetobacteraceae bacterium]